jgi:hypothetical protein
MADTKGYVKGDWNAYCDYCEGQYLASQLKEDYWGFRACPMDFTLPNPQMFVRPKTEQIVVPWSRPTDGTDAFDTIIDTTVSVVGADILVANVASGNNIYCYVTSIPGTAAVRLGTPTGFTLNLPYQVSITHATRTNTGVSSLGTITLSVTGGRFVGNTTLNPGEVAEVVANKTGNSWTRIN